jgi:hypothetical protein
LTRSVLLVLCLASAGCQWDVGTLDIRLVYAAGTTDPFNPQTTVIKKLRITVEGEHIRTRQTVFSTGGNRSGGVGGIPVGKRVRVTVEGLDDGDVVGYRGMSNELTVSRGRNRIYLFFSRVGEFSDPPTVQAAIAPEWRQRFRTTLRPGFGRAFHTANVLTDGTVLVAGGTQTQDPTDHLAFVGEEAALRSAEIFDPTPGAFVKDSSFCIDDDGDGWGASPDCLGLDCDDGDPEVHEDCGPGCVDGDGDGYGFGDDCLGPDCNDNVESGANCAFGACCGTCDPRKSAFCMQEPRAFHSVVPWRVGELMFIGGEPGGLSSRRPEYFIEQMDEFHSATVDVGWRRRQAVATLGLSRVMVAGGEYTASILDDILVANTDSGEFNQEESMDPPRAGALGVAYPDGALIIGGWTKFSSTLEGERIPSAAIERVTADGETVVVEHGLQLHHARAEAAAVVYFTVPKGETRVLVCGGLIRDRDTDSLEPSANCERIDPARATVADLGPLLGQARWAHEMTVLPGDKILVTGGFRRTWAGAAVKTAEIISKLADEDASEDEEVIIVDSDIRMRAGRGGHTATRMPNGMVLLVGGVSSPGVMSSPGYEIYNP